MYLSAETKGSMEEKSANVSFGVRKVLSFTHDVCLQYTQYSGRVTAGCFRWHPLVSAAGFSDFLEISEFYAETL
jgi:hypothetical protein